MKITGMKPKKRRRPNVIHVEIDEGGDVRVWAEGE